MSGSHLGFDLLTKRRFAPLFVTQLLNAFNDNLYKNAMVLFVVYQVLNSEQSEFWFSALTMAVFTLPFVLLSAVSGQLADAYDKARIIRIVKGCEIAIMTVGCTGLFLGYMGVLIVPLAIPLMMLALLAMGIHSTFFGPIKYAILPQHLERDEVLAGTGLVEAGTYLAVLAGTILAGVIAVEVAAVLVLVIAVIGFISGLRVPPAPPIEAPEKIDWNLIRAPFTIVRATMRIPQVFMAIIAISFFWTIGAVLFNLFPPLVKNVLTSDKEVASLFLAIFSIGVSIGSVVINKMLKGEVSARYSAPSVIVMGLFVVSFYLVARGWQRTPELLQLGDFFYHPGVLPLLACLLGIAIAGGMFVVPLYAFLTTTVKKSEAARTIAANNIVNCLSMVAGSVLAIGLNAAGVRTVEQLLLAGAMCIISAWLGWRLHKACDGPARIAPQPIENAAE